MSPSSTLSIMMQMFVPQIPVLLAALAGVIVVIMLWQRAGRAAPWALAGFGVTLVLCVAVPVVQTLLQQWVRERGSYSELAWIFTVTGFGWSFLRALAIVALIVAIFIGRTPVTKPVTSPAAPPLPVGS